MTTTCLSSTLKRTHITFDYVSAITRSNELVSISLGGPQLSRTKHGC